MLCQLSYTHHLRSINASANPIQTPAHRPFSPTVLASTNPRRRRYRGAPEGTRTPDPRLRRPLLYPPELLARSGRADLNGRPPAPKAGALPSCATPRTLRPGESINITRSGNASGHEKSRI